MSSRSPDPRPRTWELPIARFMRPTNGVRVITGISRSLCAALTPLVLRPVGFPVSDLALRGDSWSLDRRLPQSDVPCHVPGHCPPKTLAPVNGWVACTLAGTLHVSARLVRGRSPQSCLGKAAKEPRNVCRRVVLPLHPWDPWTMHTLPCAWLEYASMPLSSRAHHPTRQCTG
jgi:hypothetical protein